MFAPPFSLPALPCRMCSRGALWISPYVGVAIFSVGAQSHRIVRLGFDASQPVFLQRANEGADIAGAEGAGDAHVGQSRVGEGDLLLGIAVELGGDRGQ